VKVGDLVKCTEGACMRIDGGVGIVVQVEKYEDCDTGLSICVQWATDYLWYEKYDLEVISESR
jgi:hypothetical protein